MGQYIARRGLQAILVLAGVSTLLFFLMRVSGDPVALMAGDTATPEQVQQMRQAMGLDDPIFIQYGRFLAGVATLDFGHSIITKRPALNMVWEALPNTLILTAAALALGLAVAFPLGIYAALRRNSFGAAVAMFLAVIGQATPNFWLGMMLILLFGVYLRILPPFGSGTPAHLILPAFTAAGSVMARHSRLVRSGMLEVLNQDYIRTARAKGLAARIVITRHALKNILIPIVTVFGLDFAILISGTIVIESVFAWPGIGRLLIRAISSRDYPVVQATVFVIAVLVVLANLFVDMIYSWLDPRIRLR